MIVSRHFLERIALPRTWLRRLATAALVLLIAPAGLLAQPSQADVLRSISENMDRPATDSGRMIALLLAGAGVALLLIVLSQRRKREIAPRALNHHGKLLREVSRSLNLKSAEVRQLKLLAEQQDLRSPLVLLLCPSLLARSINGGEARTDRRILGQFMRKLTGSRPLRGAGP